MTSVLKFAVMGRVVFLGYTSVARAVAVGSSCESSCVEPLMTDCDIRSMAHALLQAGEQIVEGEHVSSSTGDWRIHRRRTALLDPYQIGELDAFVSAPRIAAGVGLKYLHGLVEVPFY